MKRVLLFSGHYGSGKTNLAVNTAIALAKQGDRVALADLDIVNPYFRSKDSARELEQNGVELIVSPYAGTNVDVPALPQEMYAITQNTACRYIVDVGGDDRGALALGRLRDELLTENNYEHYFVLNACRPLTQTAQDALEVMREIQTACGIPFTAIINNTNLGKETGLETMLASFSTAEELVRLSGVPLKAVSGTKELMEKLAPELQRLHSPVCGISLELQKTIW